MPYEDDLIEKARKLREQAKEGGDPASTDKGNPLTSPITFIRKAYTKAKRMITKTGRIVAAPAVFAYRHVLLPTTRVGGMCYDMAKWLLRKTDPRGHDNPLMRKLMWSAHYLLAWPTVIAGGLAAGLCAYVAGVAIIALPVQFIPGPVGNSIRYVTTDVVSDAFWMATTYRHSEVVYLNNSQEIDHANNLHSVSGCEKAEGCSRDNAVYFRVKPSLANDIWNLVHKGNPFFIPDQVVTPIAPGVNKCEVVSYGLRWRIAKQLQQYPYMLDAKCTSITIKDSFDNAAHNQAPVPRAAQKVQLTAVAPASR